MSPHQIASHLAVYGDRHGDVVVRTHGPADQREVEAPVEGHRDRAIRSIEAAGLGAEASQRPTAAYVQMDEKYCCFC